MKLAASKVMVRVMAHPLHHAFSLHTYLAMALEGYIIIFGIWMRYKIMIIFLSTSKVFVLKANLSKHFLH